MILTGHPYRGFRLERHVWRLMKRLHRALHRLMPHRPVPMTRVLCIRHVRHQAHCVIVAIRLESPALRVGFHDHLRIHGDVIPRVGVSIPHSEMRIVVVHLRWVELTGIHPLPSNVLVNWLWVGLPDHLV